MKEFLNDNYLLKNPTAVELYNVFGKQMPIFDFHCHLSPKEIYEDKKFLDLADVWLSGDHYKWRIMRELGIDEDYISGSKSGYDKFLKYAEALPYAIGNPLYHWSHLELKRFFDIDLILNPHTASIIWEKANKKLEKLTARAMIKKSNVKALFTTDDPTDDLIYHKKLQEDEFDVSVKPAFRPDKAINIELNMFFDWLPKLEKAAGYKIAALDDLLKALKDRIEYFDSLGCVCSDHALDVVMYEQATKQEVEMIFSKALRHEKLTAIELSKYKGYILVFLGREYRRHGWVQQYHIGALRNVSSRYMAKLGADTGFDAIEDQSFASSLAALLNELDKTDELPKTILYCLNPRDNEVLAAIKNCFQSPNYVSKIQFGSAWWFNDQKDGINRQLEATAQFGLLSKFVGMLTDSRSFLSYPRHEYFRRILCNKLGQLIEDGEYPNDLEFVGRIVEDICYNNAERFFSKGTK
mgnify:CR=1 FL=1